MSSTGWDLLSLFEERVEKTPDKSLYSFLSREGDVNESCSYERLHRSASALAATLQARGLKGSVVVLVYPQGSAFIVAFLATVMAGACPVPLSRTRSRDWLVIERTLRRCMARAMLTTSAVRRNLPASILELPGLQVVCSDQHDGDGDEWRRPVLRAEDPCFIQFTSGSTTDPRGVVISHENILHNCSLIARAFLLTEQDIGVSWLPFHHDMGLIGHILQPLYSGVHNYFLAARDFAAQPGAWLAAVSRYRGTISGGPDFAYALCVERVPDAQLSALDLREWRVAYCGAERVRASTMARFERRFSASGFRSTSLFPCYGMAESTLFVAGRSGIRMESRDDGHCDVSVGVQSSTHADPEIRIVCPDTVLERDEGEEGEILVRSRSVARGYHLDNDLSGLTFNARVGEESGFLRTGDLGYLSNGNLFFTGRLKNIIKRRGRSFHAEDIEGEALALLHDAGIARAAAFDLDIEEGAALVLLLELDGTQDAEGIVARLPELQARLWESPGILVSRIKLVRRHALPVTTSGKLQRGQCRELYLSGGFANV